MAFVCPTAQDLARQVKVIERNEAIRGIKCLISQAGRNPSDPDLQETPERVLKAFSELTAGQKENPKKILSKVFDENSDELVILKDIEFVSLCEHHMLPFIGVAHVGYLPNGKVVGLSKLARLVDCFAKRLQIQERMTRQIAESIMQHLNAKAAGVVVVGKHSCMSCRGAKKPGASMTTSSMLGELRDCATLRSEFMSLLGL